MPSEERILDLLAEIDYQRELGNEVTLEQLCGGDTELCAALRQRLAARRSLEAPASLPPTLMFPAPGAAAPVSAQALERVGRYRVEAELARGGMGVVLRARDPDLDRPLAVKVLLPQHRGRPDLEQRFLEEARLTGQLQHPGVPPVHELGRLDDGRPFFAMKLVKGRTLAALLAERTTPGHDLPRFLTVFEHTCQAVAYAHSKGVIHRDLKPSNVMVGSFGEVQVMDWGLAKTLRDSAKPQAAETDAACGLAEFPPISRVQDTAVLQRADSVQTQVGAVMGTPAYMAPEQAVGAVGRMDARTDVFGLGAVLCEILTGQPPYGGTSPLQVHLQARLGNLEPAQQRLRECGADARLVALATACLAAAPADRPPDGAAVARAVNDYQAAVVEQARAAEQERLTRAVRDAERRKRRRLHLALAASVLTLLAVGVGTLAWLQHLGERREAEERLRQVELRQAVGAGLASAQASLERGRWAEARAVLEQAAGQVGEEAPEGLQRRLEQLRADLALAERLEKVRLGRATWVRNRFASDRAERDYEAAFRQAGLARLQEAPEVVAVRLRESAIKEQLVAALDDWSLNTSSRPRLEWLLAVARQADPDEWKAQMRDPQVLADLAALERLAKRAPIERLGPIRLALLGETLLARGGQAVDLLRAAQEQHPNDFWINFTLGNALADDQPEEAAGYYRAALAIRPDASAVYHNLGTVLWGPDRKAKLPDAIRCFRKAIELTPDHALAHHNLALALSESRDNDGAIRHGLEAVRLDPSYAMSHYNLGVAWRVRGELGRAVACYREAIARAPDYEDTYVALGRIYLEQGAFEKAISTYRKLVELNPGDTDMRCNLGMGLSATQRWDEAIACYRETIRRNPKHAQAHYQLGMAWLQKGDLGQGRAAMAKVSALTTAKDPLRAAAEDRLRWCSALEASQKRLPDVLRGQADPGGLYERDRLAWLCLRPLRGLYAASTRLFTEMFDRLPTFADNLDVGNRFSAAGAAARAAAGDDREDPNPSAAERARLRGQALGWLQADLDGWKRHAQGTRAERDQARRALESWQRSADLASLRDPAALRQLPVDEQQVWEKLWADVARLRSRLPPPLP
jgi:serine/threonine-protein kinase